MLKAVPFANAAAVVTAVFYVACLALSAVSPDLVLGIASSWAHTVNLEAIRAGGVMTFGSAIWGLVTITALTWVTSWAFVAMYNKMAK